MKIFNPSTAIAAVGLLVLTASSHATLRTWSGAGTDNNWLTAANWDVLPAVNGDSLAFSGVVHQNNTNNYAAITNTAITFSSGGWVLNGNPVWLGGNVTSSTGTNVINLNTPLTAARTVSVTAGQLVMNGVISGAFGLTTGGAGTLVLGGNNTYTGTTTVAAGTGFLVITNAHALGTGPVSIPKTGTATGTLQLMLTGVNTIPNTFNGFSSTTGGATAVPDIDNVSGTNTINSSLIVTGTGGNGLTVQSDGGLLTLAGTVGTTIASRGVYFNGVGNGVVNGGITNSSLGGFSVNKFGSGTWTLNGTNQVTGAVTINAGTLALGVTGSISNVPAVTVAAGSLFDVSAVPGGWVLNAGQTLQGAGVVLGSVASVASGTALQPGAASSPGTTAGTLSFSNNLSLNNTSLRFNLSSDPTGLVRSSDQIVVAGNLATAGVNTFLLGNYVNGFIPNGTYSLIKYAGTLTGSAANFAVTNFTAGGRGAQGGYIVINPGSVDLVVTGTPPANLTWSGATNSTWDITTTSNWSNGGATDEFFNYDAVTFDDSASNFTVNVAATVTPGSVTINATNSYNISGADITGATGITKLGTGTVTLSGNNTCTGVTTYGGGSVAVATIGNTGTASPIGEGSQVLDGGTLEYTGGGESDNRGFTIGANGGTVSVDTAGAVLTASASGVWTSGGNTFTKTGPGTLAFSFQQVLTGTNIIAGGILKIPTVSVFGTDLTTPVFINGGALDLNGQTMSTKPVVASGMGDAVLNANSGTTNGAIINSGAGQNNALQSVTLTGDTAFGGTGRWDIRGNPVASLSTGGHGYRLVKAGSNFIALYGVTVDPALGNIDVFAGTLSYEGTTTGLGNPAATLSVENGGTLDLYGAVNPLNKQIILYDYSTLTASNGANTIVGPISMPGDLSSGPTFTVAGGVTLNLNGVMSGAGTLTKTGNGTLTLAATNTFTGSVNVSGGKLVVNSAQTGNGDITVNDGTSFGVAVAGTRQLMPNNYNLGSGAGTVTNEFSGLSSTATAPMNVTNLNVNEPVTINILNGNLLSGQAYPLIAFQNISGSGGFVLGTLPPLVSATLVTNGNTIALNVSSSSSIEVWSGAVNGIWNTGATPNWLLNGVAATYANGNNVQFDDTALSNTIVNLAVAVQPRSVIVNNNSLNYSFSGSAIAGTNSLTKQGSAALTLFNANTYAGGTVLAAGTLNIDNNGALGSGPLTIAGGTIDDNGSGPVTLTGNNAQNWNGDFAFTGNQDLNLGSGSVTLNANRTLAVNGGTLTVGGAIGDGGNGYALTKNGAGTLALSGTNTYAGGITVNDGTLVLQGNQSAANGGLVIGPASASGAATIAAGAVVGIAPGKLFQVGNAAGASGTTYINVDVSGFVTNAGTFLPARASIVTLNSNAVWLQSGDMEIRAEGGYYGQVNVNAGSTFAYSGADTIKLNGATGNSGRAVLNLSGGVFTTAAAFEQTTAPSTGLGEVILTAGGTLKLSASIPDLTPINGNPASPNLVTSGTGGAIDTAGFDAYSSTGVGGTAAFTKAGAGTLTLENATYTGNTVIAGGTLALTNAATVAGTNIVIGSGAAFNVAGLISPPFILATGQSISNSAATALVVGSVDASAGGIGLTYASGTPALSVTNGSLTLAAATPVIVNNVGAALGNGAYKLVSAGAGGSISGTVPASVAVTGNGLGAGGTATLSVTGNELYLNVSGAATVNTNSPVLTSSFASGNVSLSWPADHIGWRLLVQTNHLAAGLSGNINDWGTVAGSTATNHVALPVDGTKPAVFYRLVYP